MTAVDFKFTPEQQDKFNLILDETKRIYPHLMVDDISKERVKVLIAYSVIHGDLPLKKEQDKENEISVDLDNLEIKD
jgi:hypothetical protein